MHLRQVWVDGRDGNAMSLSYPGVLLTGHQNGRKVYERWVPLGQEPTLEDDEHLIDALHAALLWRNNLVEDP